VKDALGDVQTLLVLGGSSEIAQAVTRRLVARRTRRVVLAVREPASVGLFADELRAQAATVEVLAFDAARTDEHEAVIDTAASILGDIDVVLLAFGVLGDQDSFDTDAKAAVEAVTVNYVGGVSTGLLAAQRLQQQGHGTIVVLSSVAGERARKANFVYGSSKAGLDTFAQGLGDRLVGTGVHVLVVRPGFVTTRMTEGMKPPPIASTADEVADATVRALATDKEMVWVPGRMRWVMSGMRHLPRAVWRKVPF
jgi:decaprenylphospho-beta-D-erythro-pentofuranosid-2-ulose 2-reductase